MDRRLARQIIDHQKTEAVLHYPSAWSKMIQEWSSAGNENCAWLLYSANYLLRTSSVRWAIDPITLRHRVPGAPEVPLSDLKNLSFVLLTHSHADHLDIGLLQALRFYPIRWVVPQPLLRQVTVEAGISLEQIIIPEIGKIIDIDGLQILPFHGIHWQPGHTSVPATAYQVTFAGKRWLYPGDTRTYDPGLLPNFGELDGLFAHLWLGRGCALSDQPPLLEDFCRFCLGFQSQRVIVTHLKDLGREAEDYWENRHYALVQDRLKQLSPNLALSRAEMGDSVIL